MKFWFLVLGSCLLLIHSKGVAQESAKPLPANQKPSTYFPTGAKCANLVVPETAIYVNQIFQLEATVYVEGYHSIHEVTAAVLNHDSFVIKRFEHIDSDGMESGGKTYSTKRLPTTLFGLKAGDHRLGPARFDVKLFEKNPRFTGPIFSLPNVQPIESGTVRVNILPFPSGAPASFSGGVGAFEMQASASPLQLKTGDPIQLEFIVTGTGNFETLGTPRMTIPADPAAWKFYEPKQDLQTESDGIKTGRALFTQVIIPLKPAEQIPPFELSYFDPGAAKYVALRSAPIKIEIHPETQAAHNTPTSEGMVDSQVVSTNAAKVPTPRFPDILHIRKTPPKWQTRVDDGKFGSGLVLVNVLLGSLFFGLLGLGIFQKIQSRKELSNPAPKTLTFKEAMHKVRPGMEREDFYHAVLEAFLHWEEENPSAPREITALVAELKGKCETALYSEVGDHQAKPISTLEANEFLKVLKKLPD